MKFPSHLNCDGKIVSEMGPWTDYMTSPFDHTHDLGVSRSESEIALSQEWGGRLRMNEKDVSHPFMTMVLTCVTMVGWADVPDSDRGDLRRRRAVDISSLLLICWSSCSSTVLLKMLGVTMAQWIETCIENVATRATGYNFVNLIMVSHFLCKFQVISPWWLPHFQWYHAAVAGPAHYGLK